MRTYYTSALYSNLMMLVSILFAGIFFSCTNSNVESQLAEAESLIVEHPDSTIAILVDFDSDKFINSIKALAAKRPTTKFRLITRVNRNISLGTGTLLSESERSLGDRFSDEVVLTMYRLNGLIENGWNGSPLWVPNIKFPSGFCFYTVD